MSSQCPPGTFWVHRWWHGKPDRRHSFTNSKQAMPTVLPGQHSTPTATEEKKRTLQKNLVTENWQTSWGERLKANRMVESLPTQAKEAKARSYDWIQHSCESVCPYLFNHCVFSHTHLKGNLIFLWKKKPSGKESVSADTVETQEFCRFISVETLEFCRFRG